MRTTIRISDLYEASQHAGWPEGYTLPFVLPLYYSNEFLAIHQYHDVQKFFLLSPSRRSVQGIICFARRHSENNLESIPFAPFGSFWLSPDTDAALLKNWLPHLPLAGSTIRHYPAFYNGHFPGNLLSAQARKVTTDLNHHIELNCFSRSGLHTMQQRRIRKCADHGFLFFSTEDAATVYEFIASCRQQQGLDINISEEKFRQSMQLCPAHYKCYVVTTPDREIIAATVTVQVTNNIVYNYLPASTKNYARYSPMVYLLYHLCMELKSQQMQYLDLGLTSVDGEEQVSLSIFKERMTGVRSPKFTYAF